MSEPPVVESAELSKEYDSLKAVDRVTLSVPPAAVVALVGPNGAGKSTWMRMVAGLLEPSSGTARVCGIDVSRHPREAHTKLGFLPDFFGLYDELSVSEYLEYFARTYGIVKPAEIKSCIERVLEQVQLTAKIKVPLPALSRGMRQRLAIARSLINDPPLLLLDEPASGLDPEARFELQELFKSLSRENHKTLVVSSHILTELEAYSTHVAMLHQGRLVAFGRIEELSTSARRTRRIQFRSAVGEPSLATALAKHGSTTKVEDSSAQTAVVDFDGSDTDLAALVRSLVSDGVALVAIEHLESSMQEAYMKHMKGHSA